MSEALLRRDADERAFLSLMLCEGEIGNGGFQQLFENCGEAAIVAVEGATRFGLDDHARLLIRALSALWEQLEEDPGDRFDAIEEEWFALEPDLERRLHKYVQARAGG